MSGTRKAACGRAPRDATRRARAPAAARSCHSACSSAAPLLLLAFLAEDALGGIFDALALVRLGRPVVADLGGDLPDLLAVDAADHDLDRARRRDRDALRDRIDHVVAVAEREL